MYNLVSYNKIDVCRKEFSEILIDELDNNIVGILHNNNFWIGKRNGKSLNLLHKVFYGTFYDIGDKTLIKGKFKVDYRLTPFMAISSFIYALFIVGIVYFLLADIKTMNYINISIEVIGLIFCLLGPFYFIFLKAAPLLNSNEEEDVISIITSKFNAKQCDSDNIF